jgi:hypothetical protein
MIESSYNDYVSMSIDKKPSDRNYDSIIQYIDLYVEIAEGHLMSAQKAKSCLYGNIKDRMLAQEKRRDKKQARIVHDSHDSISAPCSPDSDKSWFFRKKPLDFVPGVPDPPGHPAQGPPSDNPDEAHGYHTADERDFAERDPAAGGKNSLQTYSRRDSKDMEEHHQRRTHAPDTPRQILSRGSPYPRTPRSP